MSTDFRRPPTVPQQYLREWTGGEGVLYIGKAQEKARVQRTEPRRRARRPGRATRGWWTRRPWRTTSTSTWSTTTSGRCPEVLLVLPPYNAKLWINGHDYLKRQLTKRGIEFEPLDNGILGCTDPAAMQQRLAGGLTAARVDALFAEQMLSRGPVIGCRFGLLYSLTCSVKVLLECPHPCGASRQTLLPLRYGVR